MSSSDSCTTNSPLSPSQPSVRPTLTLTLFPKASLQSVGKPAPPPKRQKVGGTLATTLVDENPGEGASPSAAKPAAKPKPTVYLDARLGALSKAKSCGKGN